MVHEVDDPASVVRPWPSDAEPVRFSALLAEPPRLASGEPVRPCVGDGLGDLPERLRAAVVRADLTGAEALYQEALERAPCDPELTSETLGSIGFLGGLLASTRGDRPEAVARYTLARSWAPGLDWSDAWPASLRVHFDEARVPEPTARLTVRPDAPVQVDGRPIDGSTLLAPGPHVVRVAGRGAWIDMPPANDVLVAPGAFGPDAIGWMGTSDVRRSDLATLLGTALGEGLQARITDGVVTWSGVTGRSDWVETGRITPGEPQGSGPTAPRRRSPVGPFMMGAGAGAAALGTTLAMQSWRAAEANRTGDMDWTQEQWEGGRERYRAGVATAVSGAIVTAGGVVVTLAGAF